MRKVLLSSAGALALLATTLPEPSEAGPAEAGLGRKAGNAAAAKRASRKTNPLLAEWSGPHGGVPPFDRVEVSDFAPALDAAMAEELANIEGISANAAPPTFENTIAALEGTGRTLERVTTVYGVWGANRSTPAFQAIEAAMDTKLAAHGDQITQNERLFQRIQTVYEARETSGLNPEQQRLTWLRYTSFVRAGARLGTTEKARIAAINETLAGLYTRFSQHLLADEEGYETVLADPAHLAGLPASIRGAAAAAAETRGQAGKWVIVNTRSSVDPVLTYASTRALREQVWRRFVTRGDNAGDRDNKPIITQILRLRAERATLLGYATHAHWRLENSMAGTPARAMALMEAVWAPAVARVKAEVADMQAIADAEGQSAPIAPWDYRYYAEKVRKAKYDLDQAEVRTYLQLDKLREGMFWAAGELYGFTFREVKGVPVFDPDMTVFEVRSAAGEHVGLWYFDPYARPGKHSGAWMTAYRAQENFAGAVTTIVSNNSNFVKGTPGEPVLISWDDARTLFHEFGHALHGLNSAVRYPSLSGTAVFRDYVEFPSQLNEHWMSTPELLGRFAVNAQGEPIPAALVAKLNKAATFNSGFSTTEYLSSALVDMRLHLAGNADIDPDAFERDTLAQLGMPPELVMRHRTPQFGHVFSSDGYSAGYYSYLWADTLTADVAEAFHDAPGGMYDKDLAKRLRDTVMSVGNAIDPAEGFRTFRGRDVEIDALMRDRGLAPAAP